mmetsp:Transcript_17883/g.26636  ORF Transcript_17883/g.26636 Transcript_17883/m.26636 type:complete len:233 (-) Transcript_17883:78-776(-)
MIQLQKVNNKQILFLNQKIVVLLQILLILIFFHLLLIIFQQILIILHRPKTQLLVQNFLISLTILAMPKVLQCNQIPTYLTLLPATIHHLPTMIENQPPKRKKITNLNGNNPKALLVSFLLAANQNKSTLLMMVQVKQVHVARKNKLDLEKNTTNLTRRKRNKNKKRKSTKKLVRKKTNLIRKKVIRKKLKRKKANLIRKINQQQLLKYLPNKNPLLIFLNYTKMILLFHKI